MLIRTGEKAHCKGLSSECIYDDDNVWVYEEKGICQSLFDCSAQEFYDDIEMLMMMIINHDTEKKLIAIFDVISVLMAFWWQYDDVKVTMLI